MNHKLNIIQEPLPPKQKLPGFLRWPLRLIAYPFMQVDLIAQRFLRLLIKPDYKIKGQCKLRGACCHFIHMGWPNEGTKLRFISKIYLLWQTEVLGFYFKNFDFVEDGKVTKVMGCRHLSKQGKCLQYKLRPALCRDWPKIHFFRKPHLLKGCGYQAILRKKK